ncbi:MAG: hypothetical protein AAGI15_16605, partial [Pseudomonadota bacterium]
MNRSAALACGRLRRARGFVALLCLGLTACTGDWVPFSGGALEGPVTPAPADWRTVMTDEVIQLETQPGDPYSVNLWVVAGEDRLYIFAGANRATWIEHIEVDPRVRLRADGRIYELRADRVRSADEFEQFAQQWEAKYGDRPRNESVDETWLMRLTPR